MKLLSKKPHGAIHYPNLGTVLMVEEFLKEHSDEYRKRALWESLPKKMMYQTFCIIIDYLIESGKILVDPEGYVLWTYNPKRIEKLIKENLIVK